MSNFKYIIMCGGNYAKFEKPKQLLKVCGEVIVERTIRLLRENGITDIAISTTNHEFDYLDVEIILNTGNEFEYFGKEETKKSSKSWFKAYYLMEQPVCYLHGDVYFSDEAIKKIVNTEVKDTMFFCCYDKWDGPKDPRSTGGREPLAYKVQNYKHFNKAVNDLLQMVDDGKFIGFPPCAWTVYRYINGLDIALNAKWYGDFNNIFDKPGDYIVINDYTNDIDDIKDVKKIEEAMGYIEGGNMKNCKVRVIKKFDDYGGKEVRSTNAFKTRNVGDEFICDYERFQYLKLNGVVELIETLPKDKQKNDETIEDEIKETSLENVIEETKETVEEAVQEVIEEQDREYVKPKKKKKK